MQLPRVVVPLLILLLWLLPLKLLLMLLLLLLLLLNHWCYRKFPWLWLTLCLLLHAEMNTFLEKVAKITHPIMRYKVIINGFDDLEELAQDGTRTCSEDLHCH